MTIPSVRTGALATRVTAIAVLVLLLGATIFTAREAAARLPQYSPVDDPFDAAVRRILDGRLDAAERLILEAVSSNPEDAAAHGLLALTRRLSGNLGGALRSYNDARRRDPSLSNVAVRIASAVVRHRQHPRFPIVLGQVVDVTQPGPEGFAWLGGLLVDRDRQGEAEIVLQEGTKRYGDHAALLRARAHLLYVRGRFSQSVAVYQEAIRRRPHDAGLWTNLGWSLLRAGYPIATIRAWERALTLDPSNAALARDLTRLRQRGRAFL